MHSSNAQLHHSFNAFSVHSLRLGPAFMGSRTCISECILGPILGALNTSLFTCDDMQTYSHGVLKECTRKNARAIELHACALPFHFYLPYVYRNLTRPF